SARGRGRKLRGGTQRSTDLSFCSWQNRLRLTSESKQSSGARLNNALCPRLRTCMNGPSKSCQTLEKINSAPPTSRQGCNAKSRRRKLPERLEKGINGADTCTRKSGNQIPRHKHRRTITGGYFGSGGGAHGTEK